MSSIGLLGPFCRRAEQLSQVNRAAEEPGGHVSACVSVPPCGGVVGPTWTQYVAAGTPAWAGPRSLTSPFKGIYTNKWKLDLLN